MADNGNNNNNNNDQTKKRKRITDYDGYAPTPSLDDGRRKKAATPTTAPERYELQRTLTQMAAEKHGRETYDVATASGKLNKETLYDKYRMPQAEHEFGGSGYDEMYRTSLTRDTAKNIEKAAVPGLDLREEVAKLSGARVATDALVWITPKGIGGHPGALRAKPNSRSGVITGHPERDNARAKAATAEFESFVPDLRKTDAKTVQKGLRHAAARARVETIRTMSLPHEDFMAKGAPTEEVYHAQFGDLRDAKNFGRMADYVHDERERRKWQAASRLRASPALRGHVPDVMDEYLKRAENNHAVAHQRFDEAVRDGSEKRINRATSTQADTLAPNETLRGTSGSKRSLSPPRERRRG